MAELKAAGYYVNRAKPGEESVHEIFEIVSGNHTCKGIFLHRFYCVSATVKLDPIPVSALYGENGRELCRCKREVENRMLESRFIRLPGAET